MGSIEEALLRGWENLFLRLDGPLHLRILFQPIVAGFFAVRAGLRDAREGRSAFLWSVFTDPRQRRELLQQGWKDVGMVFLIALLLDAIYQVIVQASVYFLELVLTGTVLALLPYVLLRGPVTRLASKRWRGRDPRSAPDDPRP